MSENYGPTDELMTLKRAALIVCPPGYRIVPEQRDVARCEELAADLAAIRTELAVRDSEMVEAFSRLNHLEHLSARVVVNVACPTCSGTGRLLNMSIPGGPPSPCPDCVRGLVNPCPYCGEPLADDVHGECKAEAGRDWAGE